MSKSGSSRIHQLDGLRGLAACSVVVFHYFQLLSGSPIPGYEAAYHTTQTLGETPLGILWTGHAAVVLFFILSGFVLFLLLENTDLSYTAYAAKRITRLYVPYAAAVALGIAAEWLLYSGPLPGLGHWINQFWSWSITLSSIWHHAVFLLSFNFNRYDFTIWTLVHEMRISLVFPIIFLLVCRLRWWMALLPFVAITAGIDTVRLLAVHGVFHLDGFALGGGLTAYSLTLHYLVAFAAGALLARHRDAVRAWYGSLSGKSRAVLAVAAFVLYLYGGHFVDAMGVKHMVAEDWPIVPGAALVLVIAAFDPLWSTALKSRPILHLGRISYSLYLFHPLVLLAALHAFYGSLPLPALLVGSFLSTFVCADLAYRLVERPAVRLSRAVANRTSSLMDKRSMSPLLRGSTQNGQ